MQGNIFISYRRGDSAAMAGRIRDRLNQIFPERVFLDAHNIDPGADFSEQINRHLDQCPLLIVLIGPDWLKSTDRRTRLGDREDYVTREVETALERKVPILPVLLDGTSVPHGDQVPGEKLKLLLQQNMLDIRHSSFERDCNYLIQHIYPYLGIHPPTRLELFLQSSATNLGYSHFHFDERMRGLHAILALLLGILTLLMTAFLFLDKKMGSSGLVDLEMIFLTACSLYPALIGKNSASKRKLALTGLSLCGFSLLVQFVLFNYFGTLGY